MKPNIRKPLLGTVGVAAVVGLWQLATIGPLQHTPLPTVAETARALAGLLPTETFWSSVGDTVVMAFIGLVTSLVVGVALGLLIATSDFIRAATRVLVEFLKPIPPIVVLPLVVLVVGPTMGMGVVLIMIGCVIAVLMQTAAGVRGTDPVALDSGRSYGLGRGERMWRIILPSALPYVGMAIRVCAPISLLVAVVAGLLGGGPGLGQAILRAQTSSNQPELFALIVVLGAMGLAVQGGTNRLERRLLHWHPAHRTEAR